MGGGALEQKVALPCGKRRRIKGDACYQDREESLQKLGQMHEAHKEDSDQWTSGRGGGREKA